MSTIAKIRSFVILPSGWHYGEGVPVSRYNAELALTLHAAAEKLGHAEFDAFPGLDGAVSVTIYDGADYFEFNIFSPEEIDYIHESAGSTKGRRFGLSFKEAMELLKPPASCSTIVFLKKPIGIIDAPVFTISHSSRPLTQIPAKKGCQSLKRNARWILANQPESASCDFILPSSQSSRFALI